MTRFAIYGLLGTSVLGSWGVERNSVIIRRADVPDSAYLALGQSISAVGKFGRMGDVTVIAPDWILTAGHVAAGARRRGTVPRIEIAGNSYEAREIHVHPQWREMGPHDIALIRLSAPVRGVRPARLAEHGVVPRGVATIVGHGATGVGTARERVEDGRRRAATSAIDSTSPRALYLSFDLPPAGTPLEGAPGPGDSGGPALIRRGEEWVVVGVSSAGFDGATGPGSYGAVDVFTRVDAYRPWIDSVMSGQVAPPPAPSTPSARSASTTAVLPDTPLGRRASAFVTAMRAGDDASILAFLNQHFADAELRARPADARLPNFRRLAGLLRDTRLASFRTEGPSSITLTLSGPAGRAVVIELIAEGSAPFKLVDWRRFD